MTSSCYCCTNKVTDKHHIIPVQYGGPESGKKVPLCPTCHDNVHREGESLFKGNPKGNYINRTNYPDKEMYGRAFMLASYITKARVRFIDGGKSKADTSRNMIQVSMSVDELALTHDLKRTLGFRSLERLIKHLILTKYQELSEK